MKGLIVLSGPIGVGKSTFAKALRDNFGVSKVATRAYILDRTGCESERRALQRAGDKLDEETGGRWVVDCVQEAARNLSSEEILLLDSARIVEQINALKANFSNVFHIHLTAARDELGRRYKERPPEFQEFADYSEASAHGTEAQVETLGQSADLVLNADHADPNTLAVTGMAAWGQTTVEGIEPLVDVIVGGQYGSEGKGNICAHIASGYAALVRIGGPNAGHMVADPPYKYVQLPSGSGSNPNAKILIGAGSTLWLPQLMKEMLDWNLTPERLCIDRQAMVIDDEDQRLEAHGLQSISSTAQGVGVASARKILNRGNEPLFGARTTLAKDVKQLAAFVGDVRAELDTLYRAQQLVLVEGTQGTELSIHHGLYPHVTSRETSAAGCLADAGIAPRRVRRVIMVVRTYPIRVGGNSGWMGHELDFQDVANSSAISVEEIKKTETGSVSGRQRRIAAFDWAQLRRATELNGATEIALTFADYLGVDNRLAKSYFELNERTQAFIRKVERVSGVPVSLVSKAFSIDAVLERGSWN